MDNRVTIEQIKTTGHFTINASIRILEKRKFQEITTRRSRSGEPGEDGFLWLYPSPNLGHQKILKYASRKQETEMTKVAN